MANDLLAFHTNGLRSAANQITTQADRALNDHMNAWQRMQSHIQSYPSNLQDVLFEVLNQHQQRLSHSYHWQISYASAIHRAVDLVEEADAEMAQWF